MTKEEILNSADTQLDGFESYIRNLLNPTENPKIINEDDEEFDFVYIINRIWVHLEDLRQDLDALKQI
jgi:hypothetical protein